MVALAELARASAPTERKPNIVLIISDDQDLRLGSMAYQSVLQRELAQKGTEFSNHWTTTALRCPSRASMLRGQQQTSPRPGKAPAPGRPRRLYGAGPD